MIGRITARGVDEFGRRLSRTSVRGLARSFWGRVQITHAAEITKLNSPIKVSKKKNEEKIKRENDEADFSNLDPHKPTSRCAVKNSVWLSREKARKHSARYAASFLDQFSLEFVDSRESCAIFEAITPPTPAAECSGMSFCWRTAWTSLSARVK